MCLCLCALVLVSVCLCVCLCVCVPWLRAVNESVFVEFLLLCSPLKELNSKKNHTDSIKKQHLSVFHSAHRFPPFIPRVPQLHFALKEVTIDDDPCPVHTHTHKTHVLYKPKDLLEHVSYQIATMQLLQYIHCLYTHTHTRTLMF